MTAVDLMRELISARANRRADEILERYGVSDLDVRLHCGFAKIRVAQRFYEPDPDGSPAIIVPVRKRTTTRIGFGVLGAVGKMDYANGP